MSTQTTNLGLVKPADQDLYNIGVHNGNVDKIDAFYGVHFCTSGTRPTNPATRQAIYETDTKKGYVWDGDSWEQYTEFPAAVQANPAPTVVQLTDGATVAVNAAAGRVQRLEAAGNRTLSAPTGAADGRALIIAHKAITAARTLTLATGAAGAFKFGTDVTAITATVAGTTDYIGTIYSQADSRWHVLSYVKGL